MTIALDPQITGNVGLYFCCYKLSLMGWNTMPTARNARGVDIIAYNKDASRYVGIQVKALSKRSPVPLGTSLDKIMGDYWIIINKVATTPSAFILLPDEVRKLAKRGEKEGRISFWLQPREYETEAFHEKWKRIGDPHDLHHPGLPRSENMRVDEIYNEYEKQFGEPLSFPPLDYGHISMSPEELMQHALSALQTKKRINWSEHFTKLKKGQLS